MICAVSLNPAVDKYLRLAEVRRGERLQVEEVVSSAGGKAINVAGVLRTLGEEVSVVGFFGGYTGEHILREVEREGIAAYPVRIAAVTRTAFVLVEDNGAETEIVEPGAAVSATELEQLRTLVRSEAKRAGLMVMSGSVPPGCPDNIYQLLLDDVGGRCPVIVDCSRGALRALLAPGAVNHPFAIKPNRREAEAALGGRLGSDADFMVALQAWRRLGINLPVISNGAHGLYAANDHSGWKVCVPHLQAVNTVGSGDATVAGLAAALVRGYEPAPMLRLAAACGSANALTKECAQVEMADVQRLQAEIEVEHFSLGAATSG